MKFLALTLLALLSFNAFALTADNLTTRKDYPLPRLLDNTSRVYPVQASFTTDGNGNIMPIGPITSNSWLYATPVASPITVNTAVQVKAAASGVFQYVTGLSASNTSATGTTIAILEGSTVVFSKYLLPSTGQIEMEFAVPLKGVVSDSVSVILGTAGASAHVSLQGFSR